MEIFLTAPCPGWYKMGNGICYKAFRIEKTFSDAAESCREDGGTLAMPRDVDTNEFLVSLHNNHDDERYWIGLHDQREEGNFEWVDGSALGDFDYWGPGEPDGSGDCVYSATDQKYGQWLNGPCSSEFHFFCQVALGTS
ncbi:collectin-10-like [Branchiostoma floridae x Branchiostoma japonicum]